ncbi:phosphoenolpyruvate--protein phosphotransferase [bacterium]|nr:phosphoenolpyruvate--protein phosphotransferase [bacterium]
MEQPLMELKGVAASSGLAVGRVCFWSDPEGIPRYPISPDQVKAELQRFDEALELSRHQIEKMRQRVEQELGQEEAAIFSSHNLLLNDPSLYAKVEKRLINLGVNLESALEETIEEMAQIFLKISDAYLRERVNDYRDIGRRVMDNLLSYQRQCTVEEGELVVMVARELMPSDTVHFHRQHVGAFVTEYGGVSSHAAILARSFHLPAVVSVPGALKQIRSGAQVLVDGNRGVIVLEPSMAQIEAAREDAARRSQAVLQVREAKPAETLDKILVRFSANLTREDEAEAALRVGAMGVGLLRTEFLFMDRREFLSEEEQYLAYRHVVEKMAPHTVIIRTLDLGEDKHFDFNNPVDEEKASRILGWRSIRLSLAHERIFMAQLKAIMRAAVHGKAKILLPMVNGVEEVRLVREIIARAAAEMSRQQISHQPDVSLGVMVETPASAFAPEILLREIDFISIGTNDLIQYVMVADRTSDKMQKYYRAASPIIVKLLQDIAQVSAALDKDVSICGELAGDPLYLPLLLGMGFTNFSVAPVLLPDLVDSVGHLRHSECKGLVQKALALSTADEVEDLLHQFRETAS